MIEVLDVELLDSFPKILDSFEGDLETLSQLVESIPKAIENMIREVIPKKLDKETETEIKKVFEEFDKAYDLVTEGKKNQIEMECKNKTALKVFEEMLKHRLLLRNILNMSLVYLISKFENFLELILKLTFKKKPTTLITKEKSLTYDELLRFSSYEKLLEFMSEKETSALMNQDIEKINQYLTKRFAIEMQNFSSNWEEFKERFYRRNLIVHNNGKINKIYVQKTKYDKRDSILEADETYLKESISLFSEMSSNLAEHFKKKFNEHLDFQRPTH